MINTLVALLGAMTVGTLVLIAMESPPIRPQVQSLMATAADVDRVLDADSPVRRDHWRTIVVHTTGAEGARIADKCHFVIEPDPAGGARPGRIRATALWRRQEQRQHIDGVNRLFNQHSIALCLTGEFDDRAPAAGQFQALTSLVRSLQTAFAIPRSQVYLHCDLDAESRSPGRAFPVVAFNAHLRP